jgi:hypothetical protein
VINLKGKDLSQSGLSKLDEIRSRDTRSPKVGRMIDGKIGSKNLSPKQKIPNITANKYLGGKINMDSNSKYTNKMYVNIQSHLVSKSPSPIRSDVTNMLNNNKKK